MKLPHQAIQYNLQSGLVTYQFMTYTSGEVAKYRPLHITLVNASYTLVVIIYNLYDDECVTI